jgi:hypothetical protein
VLSPPGGRGRMLCGVGLQNAFRLQWAISVTQGSFVNTAMGLPWRRHLETPASLEMGLWRQSWRCSLTERTESSASDNKRLGLRAKSIIDNVVWGTPIWITMAGPERPSGASTEKQRQQALRLVSDTGLDSQERRTMDGATSVNAGSLDSHLSRRLQDSLSLRQEKQGPAS